MVYDRLALGAAAREQMHAAVLAEESDLEASARGIHTADVALPGRQSGSEAWRQVRPQWRKYPYPQRPVECPSSTPLVPL